MAVYPPYSAAGTDKNRPPPYLLGDVSIRLPEQTEKKKSQISTEGGTGSVGGGLRKKRF